MRESLMAHEDSQEALHMQPEQGYEQQQHVFGGSTDQAQEYDGAVPHGEGVAHELNLPQHHDGPVQPLQVPDQTPDTNNRPQRTRKPNVRYSSQEYDLSRD